MSVSRDLLHAMETIRHQHRSLSPRCVSAQLNRPPPVLLLLSIKLLFLLWAVTACIAATAAATTGLLSSASPRIALKSVRVNKTTVYDLSDSGQQTSSSDVPDESGGFNILYSEDISIESSLSSSANAHKHPESTEESANSFYNSAPNGNNNNNNGRFNRTFDLNNIFSQEQDFVVESGSSGLTEESVESKRLSFSNEAGIYPNVGGALNYDESTAVDTASSTTALPESSPTQIYSLPAKIILSTLAASASLITVCGNFLVMTAFFLDRQIRNPTNYFLLSLAISDFLIGLFSIPILTIYLMIGVWPFGQIICNLWLSLDYTVCLTSIYTVLFITIDRFCSVKMPAKYRKWRTPNKIIVMVLLTWIIPFSLFFPSIFGWSYGSGVAFDPRNCDVAWASNKAFSVTLVFSYFWSTLVVIVVLYVFIYQVARNLERKSRDKQRKLSSLVGSGANASNALVGVVAIAVNNSKQINKGKVTKTTSVVSANRMSECDDEDEELSGVNAPTPAAANGSVKSRIGAKVGFAKSFLSGGKKNNVNKKDSGKSKRWMPTDRSSSQMMPTSMHESHSSDLARGNNNNNNNNNSSNSTTTGGYAKQSNSGGKQELVIVGNRKMMISDDMSSSYESHSDFDTAANNSAGVGSSVKRPLLSVKSNTLSVTAPPSSSSLLLKRVDEPQPVVAVATLKQQRPESLAIVAHELSPTGVTVSASNPNPSAKTQSSNNPSNEHHPATNSNSEANANNNETAANTTAIPSSGQPTEQQQQLASPADKQPLPTTTVTAVAPTATKPAAVVTTVTETKPKEIPFIDDEYEDLSYVLHRRQFVRMNSGDKEKIKEETIVIKAPPAANFFQRITTPLRQSFSRRASQNSIKHNHNNNNNSQHSNGKPPTEQPVNNNNTTTTTVNSTFVRASSLERPLSSLLGQAADIPKVKIENEKEESTSAATVTNNNKLTAANNQLKLTPSSTLTAMTASSTNSPKQPVEESCVSVISRAKATTGTNTTVTSGGGSSGTTHRQATLAAANNNTGGAAKRKKMHDNRARKALRTITFILAAFIFCFAPWHVVSVYNSFCVTCFDYPLYHHFFYSCYFLCYLNSPINPFMYALANQQFKKTFTRILKGDFRKM